MVFRLMEFLEQIAGNAAGDSDLAMLNNLEQGVAVSLPMIQDFMGRLWKCRAGEDGDFRESMEEVFIALVDAGYIEGRLCKNCSRFRDENKTCYIVTTNLCQGNMFAETVLRIENPVEVMRMFGPCGPDGRFYEDARRVKGANENTAKAEGHAEVQGSPESGGVHA